MLRCVIIDDEPLPIELLSAYASRVEDLKVLATFNDPLQAQDFIQKNVVDLIFLDIEMPHLNGIDLLKSLPVKPMTIFTTAYPEFAVDGFELDAIDYLLKPFDFERFRKAVEKAVEFRNFSSRPKGQEPDAFIFVKSEYKAVKINLKDILYIEGMDSYVKIFAGGKPVLSLMSMKSILEMLPDGEFLRVHRSFIVPVSKVQSIRNKQIKIGDKLIPIGGTYEEVVENLLSGHSGKSRSE
jgi:DNA-binding LytR/AlgR family response regulator